MPPHIIAEFRWHPLLSIALGRCSWIGGGLPGRGCGDRLHDRIEAVTSAGMKTRRKVLGDVHVDGAVRGTTDFDRPFQELITSAAWEGVWSRDQLTLRERSIVTIALLAALGHDEEVAMHVRATENTGASAEDITEALLHVAVYAGVPAANRAFKIAKNTLEAMKTNEQV